MDGHFSYKNGPQKHRSSIVFDVVFSFSDHLSPGKKVCKKKYALSFSLKNLLNIDVTEIALSAYRHLRNTCGVQIWSHSDENCGL